MNTDFPLVVYKKHSHTSDPDKGWVIPVFKVESVGEDFSPIIQSDYPNDIYISKGFEEVDKKYGAKELFYLDKHFFDADRTESLFSGNQFFTLGNNTSSLKVSTLIPVVNGSLPPKSSGKLDESIDLPNKEAFFLFDNETYYGPLTASQDGDSYVVSPKTTHLFNRQNDHILSFTPESLKPYIRVAKVSENNQNYILSLKVLSDIEYKTVDYISNEKLISFFSKLSFGRSKKPSLAKREAQLLQRAINESIKINSASEDEERVSRIKGLLGDYLSEADIGSDLVKSYLSESQEGRSFLDDFVLTNREDLLKEHQAELEDELESKKEVISKSLNDLDDRLFSKKDELAKINAKVDEERVKAQKSIDEELEKAQKKIDEAREKSEEEAKSIMAKKQSSLQETITILEDDKAKLESVCEGLLQKSTDLKNYENLERETKLLESQVTLLERSAQKYEDTLRNTDKLSQALVDAQLVADVMKGRGVGNTSNTDSKPYPAPTLATNHPSEAKGLIEKITYAFESDGGKLFSYDEMANLLVSITQSFITILSGPPGVGKTSTAIRLAKSLHMGTNGNTQNFLNISVGRGWVSNRDIIGFYNALRGEFQPSRTGLYEFLRLSRNDDYKLSPRMVLLDEANLSGIEHYWSDFLGMCDPEGRRRIETGSPDEDLRYLEIGDNTRFIATINNDATTERLSPRMIDRAPVISLEIDSVQEATLGEFSNLDGAIKYSELQSFFGQKDQAELNTNEGKKLKSIIEILGRRDNSWGQPISISARKLSAITNYCYVISPLLTSDQAIDFAIAQHVLPHIEGYGSGFKERLEALRSELGADLPRSRNIMDRIISSGSELTNSYSFF